MAAAARISVVTLRKTRVPTGVVKQPMKTRDRKTGAGRDKFTMLERISTQGGDGSAGVEASAHDESAAAVQRRQVVDGLINADGDDAAPLAGQLGLVGHPAGGDRGPLDDPHELGAERALGGGDLCGAADLADDLAIE